MIKHGVIGLALATWCLLAQAADPPLELVFETSHRLPEVQIEGRGTPVHTQGLYVTDRFFYVTGRLELQERRAVLLRFDRDDTTKYEVLDITPAPVEGEALDHPGGFDFDGTSFWIPVALSKPMPPTAILRLDVAEDRPLSKQRWQVAFEVKDHIGALAWEGDRGWLYGANWDTRRVYAWKPPDGELVLQIDDTKLVRGDPTWRLAVQDWKNADAMGLASRGVLVAGGIDKSPARDASESRAVIELLRPRDRTRLARVLLPSAAEYAGAVTNEGLAVHEGHLYLLPGDLNRDATILRYRYQAR